MAAEVSWLVGLKTSTEYLATLNAVLSSYAASSQKPIPLTTVEANFFTDSTLQRFPYLQGQVLMMFLDDQLRKRSNSLQGVMRSLVSTPAEQQGGIERFLKVLEINGVDQATLMQSVIAEGRMLELTSDHMGICGVVAVKNVKTFDVGFDFEATARNQGIASGVRPNGNAALAGLRDGMRVLRRTKGVFGNPDAEVVYIVEAPEGEKVLRWLPQSQNWIVAQSISSDLTDREFRICRNRSLT